MIFSRPPQSRALAPYIESLWVHRGLFSHRFERALPSGRMQVLVSLGEDKLCDYRLDLRPHHVLIGSGLQGVRTEPVIIDTSQQRWICGISFAVGGAFPFFDVAASELRGEMVALDSLWGSAGRRLRERLLEVESPAKQLDLLEALLIQRGKRPKPRDLAVEAATAMLEQGHHVGAVSRKLGLDAHRLIDRFRLRVGMTPKLFSRIARFQRVLGSMGDRASWSDLASFHGFSDQAHMIREFKTFSGGTPVEYEPRSPGERNHCSLSRRQISSIPLQRD